MKILIASFLCLVSMRACAQGSCATGQALTSSQVNIGQGCAPVSTLVGNFVNQTGLTTSMTAQTICSTTACPAGLYAVRGYVEVATTATIGTISGTLAFTDDVAARSASVFSGVSLASTTYQAFDMTVRSNGTQPITISITLSGVTGTPSYGIFATSYQINH